MKMKLALSSTFRRHRHRRHRWRLAQAQEKKQLAFVVNGASDFSEARRSRRPQGASRTAELRAEPQISRTGRRCRAAAADGRPRGSRRLRHHGQRGRSEVFNRRAQPHRRPGAAVHHRLRRAGHQPHCLYRLVQHRCRQAGGRDRARRCPMAASASASSGCRAPTMPASELRA